jgi:hypothetical protein
MAHEQEVEDLGDLENMTPLAVGARAGVVESPAPPTDAGEAPAEASVPTGEDTSAVIASAAKDPTASVGPSQVAGSGRGVGCRILFL